MMLPHLRISRELLGLCNRPVLTISSAMYLLFQDLIDDGVRPLTTSPSTEETFSRRSFSNSTIVQGLDPLMPSSHAHRQIHRCYQKFQVTTFDIEIMTEWKIQLLTANEVLSIISQGGSDCMVESLVEYRIKNPGPESNCCPSLSRILHSARQDNSILKVTWKRQTFTLKELIRSRNWSISAQICRALWTDHIFTVWPSLASFIQIFQCYELFPLFLVCFLGFWEQKAAS